MFVLKIKIPAEADDKHIFNHLPSLISTSVEKKQHARIIKEALERSGCEVEVTQQKIIDFK